MEHDVLTDQTHAVLRLAGRSDNNVHFARFDRGTGMANQRLDVQFTDWVEMGQPETLVVTIEPVFGQ